METNCSGASVEGRILQRPPPLIKILRPPSRVRSSSRTRLTARSRKDCCHQPCSPCADDGHSPGRAAAPVDFHRDLEDSFVFLHLLSLVFMPLNQSMHNDISGLSSQGIESWISDLTAQVPELAALRSAMEHSGTAGYYHTLREICQQPLTWLDTSARVSDSLVRLREIVAASGLDAKRGALIFTGSGSSLYAGECLGLTLQTGTCGSRPRHPGGFDPDTSKNGACLQGKTVLSFRLHGRVIVPRAPLSSISWTRFTHGGRHLIITCNQNGRLAASRRNDSWFGESWFLTMQPATVVWL